MEDTYPSSQMHVEQRGSGPKVVFVHGGEEAGGVGAFAQQFPLAQSFTLILPDLPGHGQSPAQGRKNADRDALLVGDLLHGGAHLVGHSYGGAVALRVAAQRSEWVHSLTLVEPATFDIAIEDAEVREMLMELMQAIAIPDLRLRLEAFAKTVGINKTWQDPLSDSYRRFAEDLPYLQPNNLVPARKLAEQVAQAGVPSLVISGGHRAAFENLCDITAKALGGERTVITGYGHAPQLSGEPFNTCLERFWTHQSPPQPAAPRYP